MRKIIKRVALGLFTLISSFVYFIGKIFPKKNYISVLVYHKTSPASESKDSFWNVGPERFANQMEFLVRHGFNILSVEETIQCVKKGSFPSGKNICITFDDGYLHNHTYAFPVMKKNNIRADFYISTYYTDWDKPFDFISIEKNDDCRFPLTSDQLREFSLNNIELHSHGNRHIRYDALSFLEIKEEIKESIEKIKPFNSLKSFVVPYGLFGRKLDQTIGIVKELGFDGAFMGKWGGVTISSDPYDLPRVPIYGIDTDFEFKLKVFGSYDWLGYFLNRYKESKASSNQKEN